MNSLPPVLGFAAFSGAGKTSLLKKLIPLLKQRGLRLGLIKHSHHTVEIDHAGKDSYILRKAGAAQMLVASARRTVLMINHPSAPPLDRLLGNFEAARLDLVLVEGFKNNPISKIELHRPRLGHPLLCTTDPNIIAVVSDAPLTPRPTVPLLDLNDPLTIVDFIAKRFRPDHGTERNC